jgi:hypothetical protein
LELLFWKHQFHPKAGNPMEGIVPQVRFSAKQRLETGLRQCAEARKRIRHLIILNRLNGRGPTETARVLGVG